MRLIVVTMAALGVTLAAAAVGAVTVAPWLAGLGAPAVVTGLVVPGVVLGVLLVVPAVLSGSWLWGEGKRRRAPGVVSMAPVWALVLSGAVVVGSLRASARPGEDVAKDAVRLAFAVAAGAAYVPGAGVDGGAPGEAERALAQGRDAGVGGPGAPVEARGTSGAGGPTGPGGRVEGERHQAGPATAEGREGTGRAPGAGGVGPGAGREGGEGTGGEVGPVPAPEVRVEGARVVRGGVDAGPEPVEGQRVVLAPGALPPSLYRWVDDAGVTHFALDASEVPAGRQAQVIAEDVVSKVIIEGQSWSVASVRAAPAWAGEASGDPMLPSAAELYWRPQFQRAHQRLEALEVKRALKQRQRDQMPVAASRAAIDQELDDLAAERKRAEADLNELDRLASQKAVPRAWR